MKVEINIHQNVFRGIIIPDYVIKNTFKDMFKDENIGLCTLRDYQYAK